MSNAAQVVILGLPIDRVGYSAMLAHMATWIGERRAMGTLGAPARQICTVNPEFVVDAQRDAAFRQTLLNADLRVADGVGVAWAARLLGAPVPERVTGSDGIDRIAAEAARQGWRVYFLGAGPGVAQATATLLATRHPGLPVAGWYSGSPNAAEWPLIEEKLRVATPDVLFVAYGHPRQDFWIGVHRAELPCAVALGVGGAFDYVTGVAPRAPVWMRRLGLEWLYRLGAQPWRWRRMMRLPLFVLLVVKEYLQQKVSAP
jgi:N-acetylglucosaminyldiphosphoundecaprenol N-acetyl-beta-D-mannosaminyltransferase